MKKYLLPLLFLSLPLALVAQQDPMSLYSDFYDGVKSISSIVWDDHTNIATVKLDNENFEVTAVNDQLQKKWSSSFAGSVMTTERFKDKIIVIAATEHSTVKGNGNTYVAYLIDPTNGKQLLQKEVYHGDDTYMEVPMIFTGDGSFVKICIRQTGFTRQMHVGLLGALSIDKYTSQLNETRQLNAITLNDKLDAENNLKLPVPAGTVISMCANIRGDIFISWMNGQGIKVDKYADGSATPAKELNADVAFVADDGMILAEQLRMVASATNPDVIYYGTTYANQDNDIELGVGKLDFTTGKKSFVSEAFDRNHVKALEKSFVAINKKTDDVDLGSRRGLHIRYLGEAGGILIATVTSQYTETASYGAWNVENSVLVNGYDENLGIRFQQILPANYKIPNRFIPIAYHHTQNKFYVIGNEKTGINTVTGIYGCLDLASGKWEKMQALSKKHISSFGFANGYATMWFGNSFAVSYFSTKGFNNTSFNVALQQNEY